MFLPIREQPLTTEKPIKETIKQKNDISIIKQKIDSYLHLKMYKDKRCLVFVDID
jgi:adenine-specific DNA methylase